MKESGPFKPKNGSRSKVKTVNHSSISYFPLLTHPTTNVSVSPNGFVIRRVFLRLFHSTIPPPIPDENTKYITRRRRRGIESPESDHRRPRRRDQPSAEKRQTEKKKKGRRRWREGKEDEVQMCGVRASDEHALRSILSGKHPSHEVRK